MNTPNAKYVHVFAIVRLDTFQEPDTFPEDVVTVKKIVWDQVSATQEVERLNKLNGAKGCLYFSQRTRLEKLPRALPVQPKVDSYAYNGHLGSRVVLNQSV